MKPETGPAERDYGIVEQMFAEAEAMARYALASGLRVPASVLYAMAHPDESPAVGGDEPPSSSEPPGAARSPEVVKRMAAVHQQLAQLIAPATPRTILLLSRERRNARLRFLGPVRLVRHMMAVAIVSLATFVLTALSPDVNDVSGDIFTSSGVELLINELFLLSAAAVGAAFTALFRANRYVANGTYDPKYESSYWVRFILGLIAGIVLPALIPIEGGQALTRPLLALLGGFSASVVYRILSRLVDTLESLVQGDATDMVAAREQALKAQVAEQRLQDQLRMAGLLMKLRDQLASGSRTDELQASVAHLIDELTPFKTEPPDSGVPAPQDGGSRPPVALN
jgi:hypothetical protein